MQTTNIISTPDITGNIGSCTTEIRTLTRDREHFWRLEKRDVETNSCTGEVHYYDYYTYRGEAFVGGIVLAGIAFFVLIMAIGLAAGALSKD